MKHEVTKISLGDLQVSFLLSGGNPISGISHQGREVDQRMYNYFDYDTIFNYLQQCEHNGIDTIVARIDKFIIRVLTHYWNHGGKIQWIGQTAKEYGSMLGNIKEALLAGASAVYVHGGTFDRCVLNNDYDEILSCIDYCHSVDKPIGIASHIPQNLRMAAKKNWQNDFYLLSLYNVGNNERFDDADRILALKTLLDLNKPCLLYKVLAAGRKSLAESLEDVSKFIRPCDGILIGMCPQHDPTMVEKNAEYVFSLRENLFDPNVLRRVVGG